MLYDLNHLEWERLPDIFREGLDHSLSAAGFPNSSVNLLCGSAQPLSTKTHGRREVAFLNQAWDDVMTAELALDESSQSQHLLDQIVNANPSRCVGFDGLGQASERLSAMFREMF